MISNVGWMRGAFLFVQEGKIGDQVGLRVVRKGGDWE
jgi:hypothetical protein